MCSVWTKVWLPAYRYCAQMMPVCFNVSICAYMKEGEKKKRHRWCAGACKHVCTILYVVEEGAIGVLPTSSQALLSTCFIAATGIATTDVDRLV